MASAVAMAGGSARDVTLRAMLEQRRRVLEDQVHQQIVDARSEKDIDRGRGDRDEAMEFDQQGDVALTVMAMRVATLQQVEGALRRLEAGQYGHCQRCGCDISESRLAAIPFARHCRDCEAAREHPEPVPSRRRRVALSGALRGRRLSA